MIAYSVLSISAPSAYRMYFCLTTDILGRTFTDEDTNRRSVYARRTYPR